MYRTAVYAADIPKELSEPFLVSSQERQTEIDRCVNPKVRREKYFVWKLLEHAIEDFYGINIDELCFEKSGKGKWTADGVHFSLSHTNGACAVAVSDGEVGVDIEEIRRYREGIETRILTEREYAELDGMSERDAVHYIIEKWTQKESIFKTLDRESFLPMQIETDEYAVISKHISRREGNYILSVCSESRDSDVRFYFV